MLSLSKVVIPKMPRTNIGPVVYSDDAKRIVKNSFEFCKKEKECGMKISLAKVSDRTAALTGVSLATIKRITSEAASPETKKDQPSNQNSFDDFDQGVIRRTINTMYTKQKVLPTLGDIKIALEEAIGFTGSKSFLWKRLRRMGFSYRRCRVNRKVLMERSDVVQHRIQFLRRIKRLRDAGYTIAYTDETYVHSNHVVNKCWQDENIGLKIPFSKGERMIVLHAGSRTGFIPGAALAKSSSGDYHSEMNSSNFMKWLQEMLIPNLPPKSALVMDNAAYHNIQIDRCPTTATRKAKIQGWLTRHNIDFDSSMLKNELLQLCKLHKQQAVYVVDDILAQHGHQAIRLPPYHADLNPIELIWAQLKGYVARKNLSFKLADVKVLIQEGLSSITAETGQTVLTMLKNWKEFDIAIDTLEDPVIINLVSESDTTDGSGTGTASEDGSCM